MICAVEPFWVDCGSAWKLGVVGELGVITIAELVAGFHEMDLERDVIDQESNTFEFHATTLAAAVGTQIFHTCTA